MSLLAGTARSDISPGPGCELMGYGARVGKSTRLHDPLYARALCLIEDESPGGAVLIVCADLCLMAPTQAERLRREISDQTEIDPNRILISCSHTHSGPDTGLGALMTGRQEPEHLADLFQGIADTAVRAHRALAPSRARWGRADAAIGRNRRLADGPVDSEVRILTIEDAAGHPRATLFNYACHGTVLGHDNLEISADWAGVACERIEKARGGTALFLLGAHADIDPRTRGLMDLAIDGQSIGLGFDAVRVLGDEVADAVLQAEPSTETPFQTPIAAAHTSLDLPLHLGDLEPAQASADLDARRDRLAETLEIAPSAFPRTAELLERVSSRAEQLSLQEARDLLAQARLYVRDRTAPFWVIAEGDAPRHCSLFLQVLRIGDTFVLALPVEPTTEVGLDWKRRSPGGIVAGIANGWMRYLPHPRDLAEPFAHQRYEILSSILAPGACERILEEAGELRDRLL